MLNSTGSNDLQFHDCTLRYRTTPPVTNILNLSQILLIEYVLFYQIDKTKREQEFNYT